MRDVPVHFPPVQLTGTSIPKEIEGRMYRYMASLCAPGDESEQL